MHTDRLLWSLALIFSLPAAANPANSGSFHGPAANRAIHTAQRSPSFDPLEFPDGRTWILSPNGIGRPFVVRLRLGNQTGKAIKLWDLSCSEGSWMPCVVLTGEQGDAFKFRPTPVERITGIGEVVSIAPRYGVLTIDLDLLRLVGGKQLPPGKYRVQAVLANQWPGDEAVPYFAGIWTGIIVSEVEHITIVAPNSLK